MQEYTTILDRAEDEFVERKSRFIGAIAPVETEEEALDFIAQIKHQHRDATHNTYAYVLKNGVKRYSDDGEPQGTAGVPMLDCLEKEGLVDVAVVVTRYFGGILLGAGGLTRAYSKSARDALAAAGAAEMGLWATADIPCPYALFERVRGEVTALGGMVDEAEYGADIRLRVSLPAQTAETLRARLTELSAGGIAMTVTAEEYRPGGRVEI